MSTQRYISTSFWEDEWVGDLAWEEKYLYLYLLTNPRTRITGIYKAPLRMMAFETGLSRDRVEQIMHTFAQDGKAYYYKEHVIIPAWPRHQNWKKRERIKKGIQQQLIGIPPEILEFAYAHGYAFPKEELKTQIRGYYFDSDYDSDYDLEEEREERHTKADATHTKTQQPMNQTTYNTLITDYDKTVVDDYFERVSDYCAAKGKSYKDHAATVRNWLKRDGAPKKRATVKTVVDFGEVVDYERD